MHIECVRDSLPNGSIISMALWTRFFCCNAYIPTPTSPKPKNVKPTTIPMIKPLCDAGLVPGDNALSVEYIECSLVEFLTKYILKSHLENHTHMRWNSMDQKLVVLYSVWCLGQGILVFLFDWSNRHLVDRALTQQSDIDRHQTIDFEVTLSPDEN